MCRVATARAGAALSSEQSPARLSTGALVWELELTDAGRLHYELAEGQGPSSGWVSVRLQDRPLLIQRAAEERTAAAPAAADAGAGPQWYSRKPVVEGRRLRVACLHGTASNASLLAFQLGRLKAACKDSVELVFLEGPLRTEDVNPENRELAQQRQRFPGQEFFQYAVCPDQLAEGGRLDYEGLGEALAHLQAQLRAHEPIDGALGFSQGANVLLLLAAAAVRGEGAPLAFAIHICGTEPGWLHRFPGHFDSPLALPSLHVTGDRDFTTDRSGREPFPRGGLEMAKLYLAPEIARHSADHRPLPPDPKEAAALAQRLLDFMQAAAAAPARPA